jgi:holdfast attachment protein HfaA
MTRLPGIALLLAAFLIPAGPTFAQGPARLPTAGSAAHGYGGAGAAVGQPTRYGLRDGAGNLVIVNGTLSPYGRATSGGSPGSGGETALAIGNQITVDVGGSWNTIIIDAVQQNSGDITATAGRTRAITLTPVPTQQDTAR